MNKFAGILTLVFLLTGTGAGEEGFPLVSGICLVESEAFKKGLPPGQITIGLEVRTDVLYKISTRGHVLKGGLFRRGFNSFTVSAAGFFDRTETHTYVLECKAGENSVEKEITIDIRILPLYMVQKRGEKKKQHAFSLSFYLGDRLIYSTRKFSPQDISFEIELPPSSGRYDPFGLIDGTQKPASGVPIFGAVAGLYHLVKALSPGEDRDEKRPAPQKKQRIETMFLKTDIAGDVWQWQAVISLKTDGPRE